MYRFAFVAAATLLAAEVSAQMPTERPGAPDVARVKAGHYEVDPSHTQIVFTVDHLGFNSYWGIFGNATGTLDLDPARLAGAKVAITVPMAKLVTTSPELNEHLLAADFFDAAKFPTATFTSTKMTPTGHTTAKITGLLTLHGVTKPILLDAKFIGAGVVPMSTVNAVGFEATTTVRRSDFGVSFGTAFVSDYVPLRITAAFNRTQ
jgi:polyisoprenoid-binding protein YceI